MLCLCQTVLLVVEFQYQLLEIFKKIKTFDTLTLIPIGVSKFLQRTADVLATAFYTFCSLLLLPLPSQIYLLKIEFVLYLRAEDRKCFWQLKNRTSVKGHCQQQSLALRSNFAGRPNKNCDFPDTAHFRSAILMENVLNISCISQEYIYF